MKPAPQHPPSVFHLVYNLIRGGTEGQCARLAMAFARRGHRHAVGVSVREGFFLPAVEEACGPVFHMDIHRLVHPKTLLELRKLARHVKQGGFDLVHAWDADAAIFGSIAARWAGVPLITSRRDLGQIYAPRKLRMMEAADRAARLVVVNARSIGERLQSLGLPGEKIRCIPNMLELAEFDELKGRPFADAGRLPRGQRIGMVCRLDPEKDLATLVRAAIRVCAACPNAVFVVAGDGPDRPAAERTIQDAGLADRFVFLGDVKAVPSLLKEFTVGVLLPSANEGLSNSILEYQAASLPVVATDCGGNAELVRDGRNGYIVPVGDDIRVADALLRLLNEPGLARQMGEAGRRQLEAEHHPDAVCDRFGQLYEEALQASLGKD